MIFKIYYALIYTGWSYVTILLGSYMSFHAEARDMDLGIFFTITPTTIFLRPLISAYADRKQTHKSLLVTFLLITCLAYIPFVLWPFYKPKYHEYLEELEQNNNESLSFIQQYNLPFIILSLFHTIGSIGFCSVRALGDACAVNYAKQTGGEYAAQRVYGAYSYGLAGYLIGFVNEDNKYFPDFVPGLLLFDICLILSAIIIYVWPNEYFKMSLDGENSKQEQQQRSLSKKMSTTSSLNNIIIATELASKKSLSLTKQLETTTIANLSSNKFPRGKELWEHIKCKLTFGLLGNLTGNNNESVEWQQQQLQSLKILSVKQQFEIFCLLMRRDFRIPLYLLVIFYTGFTAYAPLNYVFIYLDDICRTKNTCSGAEISALMIAGFCILEGLSYKLMEKFQITWTCMLMTVLFSITGHYYFYGLLLDKLSPYWFIVESLHGVEYAFSLVLCLNLGYSFAREVEFILPELIQRGTVKANDREEQELVRVSLMATMSSLYTLVYDGIGCSLGALVFGQIAGRYSFQLLWICIGSLAIVGIVLLSLGHLIGKLFNIKPQILKQQEQLMENKTLNC